MSSTKGSAVRKPVDYKVYSESFLQSIVLNQGIAVIFLICCFYSKGIFLLYLSNVELWAHCHSDLLTCDPGGGG